mmetsp:Transcript_98558/g.306922  ORF Transcript_98558/g.306922 Transcript_98558/m.306922 type:complete len:273 (+) Transcript_98558:271-1089(+)
MLLVVVAVAATAADICDETHLADSPAVLRGPIRSLLHDKVHGAVGRGRRRGSRRGRRRGCGGSGRRSGRGPCKLDRGGALARLPIEVGELVRRLHHLVRLAVGEVGGAAELQPDAPEVRGVAVLAAAAAEAGTVVAVFARGVVAPLLAAAAARVDVRDVRAAGRIARAAAGHVVVLRGALHRGGSLVTAVAVAGRVAAVVHLRGRAGVPRVGVHQHVQVPLLHTVCQELGGHLIDGPRGVVLQHERKDARDVRGRHGGARVLLVVVVRPRDG